MKIVRKFNDFVRVRINEDVLPQESPEIQPGLYATEEMEDPSNIIEEPESQEGYEEEESGDVIQNELNQLASDLGATKTNNVIEYDGHEIEYYSETNSFAIDKKVYFMINNKKTKLKTAQDVINYLSQESQMKSEKEELEPALESRRFKRHKVSKRK